MPHGLTCSLLSKKEGNAWAQEVGPLGGTQLGPVSSMLDSVRKRIAQPRMAAKALILGLQVEYGPSQASTCSITVREAHLKIRF
jgi:hypothetical protein